MTLQLFEKKIFTSFDKNYSAKIVYKYINKKRKKVYFPYLWAMILYILSILPFFIIRILIKMIK